MTIQILIVFLLYNAEIIPAHGKFLAEQDTRIIKAERNGQGHLKIIYLQMTTFHRFHTPNVL